MAKVCDNQSVGVIIEDGDKIAFLKRANFPIAIAPPAGHVDDHGSPEQAAMDEVNEEVGLTIAPGDLLQTAIYGQRVNNPCGRAGGDHHVWWIFRATTFEGTLTPDPEETQGAGWYTREQIQELAGKTKRFQKGEITDEQWQKDPGLEEVWLDFMTSLGYVK